MIVSGRIRWKDVCLQIVFIGLSGIPGAPIFAEKATLSPNSGVNLSEPDLEKKELGKSGLPLTTTNPAGHRNPDWLSGSIFSSVWVALGFVLLLIILTAWLLRKAYPGSRLLFGSLPMLQVLGRTHLGPKHTLALVKLDSKLLLLGLTDHQINPLMTIEDPEEVSRLVTLLEQSRSSGLAAGFKQFFSRERDEMVRQQESESDMITNSSTNVVESDVLQLKSEINSLLNKVQKLKGIGGQDPSA